MTEPRRFKWDGDGPPPFIGKVAPGEHVEVELTDEALAKIRAGGGRLVWTNEDGSKGHAEVPRDPMSLLWPLPFALILFVFLCCVGLMFYALTDPKAHPVLFVLSIAAVVAMPHVPRRH